MRVPAPLDVAHAKQGTRQAGKGMGALALLLLLLVFHKLSYDLRVGAVPLAAERASRLVLIKLEIPDVAGVVDRRWIVLLALFASVFKLDFGHG